MLARVLPTLEELHVGLDAALPRVHAAVDDVLDQPVGRMLERHFFGADDVAAGLVFRSERLRWCDVIGAKAGAIRAGMRGIFFLGCGAHLERASGVQMSVGGR